MDIIPILLQLFLVLFLIFMNGFFVAAEFSVVKIRPSRLETLIEAGNKRAAYAKKLTDHLDTSLSVTQLGITRMPRSDAAHAAAPLMDYHHAGAASP